jgi:RNA polymerase subunit RPABC4/transcription elongation factor Spt4
MHKLITLAFRAFCFRCGRDTSHDNTGCRVCGRSPRR